MIGISGFLKIPHPERLLKRVGLEVQIAVTVPAPHHNGGPVSVEGVFLELAHMGRKKDARDPAATPRGSVRQAAVNGAAVM